VADQSEILTRGQANRNRYWAGLFSRGRTLGLILAITFLLGALVGWVATDDLEQRRASAYWSIWWDQNGNPYSSNLGGDNQRNVERYLAKDSPLTKAKSAVGWRMLVVGLVAALGIGLPIYRHIRRKWSETGERLLDTINVRGSEVVDSDVVAALVKDRASAQAVTIGGIPIPETDEARHFLMVGATGTGKTTAIWEMLDQVERRGDHAFVHDVDGSYLARYYQPERGDIVLNPFDARCAYWNPFSDVQNGADADRLASFIVSQPATHSGGEDIWTEQARIVAGAIIRRLWEKGHRDIEALVRALRDFTPDELRELTAGTEAARVFQKDAEKATASVLFCLAEASKVAGLLKLEKGSGAEISFDAFYNALSVEKGPKPWIFLASRKRNFAAARPLLGCWLDCAIASILDRSLTEPPRAWLVLDELPALPRAKGLLTLLPEGRKFGAAVVIAFQAIGQLRETYGANAAGTIVGQTASQLVMRLGDPESTKWATQLIGQAEVEDQRSSHVLNSEELTDQGNISGVRQTKALVLDSEISALPPLTGFLRLSGLPVARVTISRDHMDRPAKAEGTIPLPSPSAIEIATGWTEGGAL
jgi:type IV secretory pathway TraG/TraD family ATPase VirD4